MEPLSKFLGRKVVDKMGLLRCESLRPLPYLELLISPYEHFIEGGFRMRGYSDDLSWFIDGAAKRKFLYLWRENRRDFDDLLEKNIQPY